MRISGVEAATGEELINHRLDCSGCPTCSYALGDQLREALYITRDRELFAAIDAAKLRINQEKT